MFYMQDNFFDPRVLVQIPNKTGTSSHCHQFLAVFIRLNKTINLFNMRKHTQDSVALFAFKVSRLVNSQVVCVRTSM